MEALLLELLNTVFLPQHNGEFPVFLLTPTYHTASPVSRTLHRQLASALFPGVG